MNFVLLLVPEKLSLPSTFLRTQKTHSAAWHVLELRMHFATRVSCSNLLL